MKNSLPRFTTAILWWVGVVAACGVGWKFWFDTRRQPPTDEAEHPLLELARPFLGGAPEDDERMTRTVVDEPAVPALFPDSTRTSVAADNLLPQAIRRLMQYRSLAARIRQRIEMFDQPLSGSGVYQQWGTGQDQRRVRLELKLQVAGQTASLQQIGDGRFLWDRRDILGKVTLGRIDLRKVRQAIEDEPQLNSPEGLRHWMLLGGLAQLLSGIDESFEFTTAEPARLGNVPAWVLVGGWKPAALERYFPRPENAPPGPRRAATRLPEHWPERVQIVLGADENIPLFPYRIEYQRPRGDATASEKSTKEQGGEAVEVKYATLAILELFEVQPGADLDPEGFRYDPGKQEVVDQTQAYLKRLRGETPTERPPPLVD